MRGNLDPKTTSPNRAKNHIAVDVDGILFPFTRAFSNFLGKPFEESDCPSWRVYPYSVSKEESSQAMHYAHSKEAILKYGLYPGAAAGLKALTNAGMRVSIVTRRSRQSAPGTLEALRELGLRWNGDFVAYPYVDKIKWCEENSAQSLIDDKPQTIEAALKAKLNIYTLSWPYNRHLSATQATSWAELVKKILN
jgi:phosphoglycolate phosphatase-like HAD superfamily hydrolase